MKFWFLVDKARSKSAVVKRLVPLFPHFTLTRTDLIFAVRANPRVSQPVRREHPDV